MRKSLFVCFCFLGLSMAALQPAGHRAAMLGGSQSISQPAAQASATAKRAAAKSWAKIPLFFIPNRGQLDERVSYYIQKDNAAIYFTSEGLTYALAGPADAKDKPGPSTQRHEPAPRTPRADRPQRWVIKLDFVGARPNVKPEGVEKSGAIISYFKGKPLDWKTGLPSYSSIRYRDLWPGIDLVYRAEQEELKYEFIVRPGADAKSIQLAIKGPQGATLDKMGRLTITTPLGGMTDKAPVAFQNNGSARIGVDASYSLKRLKKNEYSLGFEVGSFDRSRELVIDPAVLVYCGYIGGLEREDGLGIAVDSQGSAYVTGFTSSDQTSFPVRVGPDLTYAGPIEDAFVAKIGSDGRSLVYCGFIGGNGNDSGQSIAVDDSGQAYVAGWTDSDESSFPIRVGPDLTANGGNDAFVAKVNSAGTGLVYCGYIGGDGEDEAWGISVDGGGHAYVTGGTNSSASSFPIRVGPNLTPGGEMDAFVAKVSADGHGLDYCGYIGGAAYEHGTAIAVDAWGNAYVTGETNSNESSFPVKVGPYLKYHNNGDVFVAKVNAAGNGLSYCGYIGGNQGEIGGNIAVDKQGNAYITGTTYSDANSFPVKVGPYHNLKGFAACFVAKVHLTGHELDYCGYIGGDSGSHGTGIAVDEAGCAYVTGMTWSDEGSFPVKVGPDLTYNGEMDVFAAKVTPTGGGLVYCGYIGGIGPERSAAIALDPSGNAYIIGTTESDEATFPVWLGPGLVYKGAMDVFVAKIGYENGAVPGETDLKISKTVDNISPLVYDEVTYTLTAGNNGPDTGRFVQVDDRLASDLGLIEASASKGTYDFDLGLWNVGALNKGETATLTLRVRVYTVNEISNTAVIVTQNDHDPNPANNRASVQITSQQSVFPPISFRVQQVEVDYIFFKIYTNRLTWRDNSLNKYPTKSYRIYRGSFEGGPVDRLAEVNADVFSYEDRGIPPGPRYYYMVTTVNVNGQESGYAIWPTVTRKSR